MPPRSRGAEARVERPVFLTVGSTSFDALVSAADDPALVQVLERRGYTSLTLQLGRGAYLPTRIVPDGQASSVTPSGFTVRYFRYEPSLDALVAAASLIISHAGAGSIFEALRAGKLLLVVANEALMDNHQAELAEALAAQNYLAHCTPGGLREAVAALPDAFAPYPKGDARPFAAAIDALCGFR